MSTSLSNRSGALSVLAICFLVSAALRAGDVIAALPAVRDDGFGNRVVPAEQPHLDAGQPSPGEAGALAAELREQAKRLTEREARMSAREQTLEETERRLRERLEELEALRLELEAETGRAASAAEADVRHLAAMYRSMKPKQAGRIFDAMEPSFAAGFLGEMGADAAAQILSNMTPDKAYAVSVLLAGRSLAGAPTPAGQ